MRDFQFPPKLYIANVPTRIEKLGKLSKEFRVNLYIKRDDLTGIYVSGNKIRKLEYVLRDAMDNGCDTVITCGGIQSNHCRTTTAAAVRAGLKPVLLLRGEKPEEYSANILLNRIFGAEIVWVTEEHYRHELDEHFQKVSEDLKKRGHTPYVIPEGASNAVGALGYLDMMRELKNQMSIISFDSVVCPVGSGGTIAGMVLGKKLYNVPSKIVGFNVCDTAEFYREKSFTIIEEAREKYNIGVSVKKEEINIIDGYVGEGYAQATADEIKQYIDITRKEGILFDHVYTGKTMRGLLDQLGKGNTIFGKNILFIHTGGLFGLFARQKMLNKYI